MPGPGFLQVNLRRFVGLWR